MGDDNQALMDEGNKLLKIENISLEDSFRSSLDSLDDDKLAGAWSMIDAIESVAKERKAALREELLRRVEKNGEEGKNGSYTVQLEHVKILKEKRMAKLPDPKLVEKLVKEAGLEYDDAFTPKREWSLDPSKLDFLVQGGKLPGDQLEASKKITWALKVKPDKALGGRLDGLRKQLMPPDDE